MPVLEGTLRSTIASVDSKALLLSISNAGVGSDHNPGQQVFPPHWQQVVPCSSGRRLGGNSIRSNSIMGDVAMDKTLQSESLDEILRSSCTHAEISMKRRQPLQAEPLSQQFHLQWQPQVLSCAGEGILETINMHYYRFPRVNQEGFEGPPSFTSRVLIAS